MPVLAPLCRCRLAGRPVPIRYEVVEVADAPTDELVELEAVGAVVVVVLSTVVLLGSGVDGGAVVVVALLGTVVDEVVVVVDFGGVVVVVVVVVVGDWWTTVLEFAVGSGGYWMYRAPKPRKATAISAVDRRTGSRGSSGRLMKPRSPFRFGRFGRSDQLGRFGRSDRCGRRRRFAMKGPSVASLSVMAPSWSRRPWAAS